MYIYIYVCVCVCTDRERVRIREHVTTSTPPCCSRISFLGRASASVALNCTRTETSWLSRTGSCTGGTCGAIRRARQGCRTI